MRSQRAGMGARPHWNDAHPAHDHLPVFHATIIGWAVTLAAISGLIAFDLWLSRRKSHAVGLREAAGWSLFYVAVAVLFAVILALVAGWGAGTRYFAGYVDERSLSIDNLFVFVLIMSAFAVPAEQQPRLLMIGIVGTGLVVVLAFIGVKLVLEFLHVHDHRVPEISTALSPGVIAIVLAATTIASLARVRRDPRRRAHAGSLRAAPEHVE